MLVTTKPRLTAIALAITLLAATSDPARAAAEYYAGAGMQFTYSDVQVLAAPVARVSGDTRPGSEWIAYDVTTDAGAIKVWAQFYSCCVNLGGGTGYFQVDDLIFASPGGTGGTATVSLNLFVNASIDDCHGGNLRVNLRFGSQWMDIGVWEAGGPTCSGSTSTGIFTGYGGSSISGYFTSPTFEVPLDQPITFRLGSGVGLGSYQQVVSMDSYVSFAPPGSGSPVFNIVSGPPGVTVQTVQANVSNNVWSGGVLLAVDDVVGSRSLMLGPPNPNPSSGLASFAVSLPTESHVTLDVYDVRGRLVDVAHDARLPGGVHRIAWDARRAGTPAGVYFVRLRALGREETQRIVIAR